jgi:phosphatidylglycerophosphatase A
VLVSGTITSGSAEKTLGKDSSHIVIDEFCGYLLAVLFLPKVTGYLLAGLILFRVFDILKPPPIRKIEETMPGGSGIMLDDVMAAVYANICLQVWRMI